MSTTSPRRDRSAAGHETDSKATVASANQPQRVCFYGKAHFLSNMHAVKFFNAGQRYSCVEQFMQAAKAAMFGDQKSRDAIMKSDNPMEHKRLGRRVKPFEEDRWAKESYRVVLKGVYLKFTNSDNAFTLGRQLLDTGDSELVEASPTDALWGVGLSVKDAEKHQGDWPGKNLLGKALMEVREQLKKRSLARQGLSANPLNDNIGSKEETGTPQEKAGLVPGPKAQEGLKANDLNSTKRGAKAQGDAQNLLEKLMFTRQYKPKAVPRGPAFELKGSCVGNSRAGKDSDDDDEDTPPVKASKKRAAQGPVTTLQKKSKKEKHGEE